MELPTHKVFRYGWYIRYYNAYFFKYVALFAFVGVWLQVGDDGLPDENHPKRRLLLIYPPRIQISHILIPRGESDGEKMQLIPMTSSSGKKKRTANEHYYDDEYTNETSCALFLCTVCCCCCCAV